MVIDITKIALKGIAERWRDHVEHAQDPGH